MTYRTVTLGFGAFFTVAAFVCLLVALCTNQWVIIQVDRSADSTLQIGSTSAATLAAFTRYRGIFKECYDDKEATKPYVRVNDFKDDLNECIFNDFMVNRRVSVNYTSNYKTRTNLLIAMVVFICLALLLCVIGFIVFCYSVMLNETVMTRKWSLATKWAGILLFTAAFSTALGMAFYHGAEYMETEVIDTDGSDAPYPLFFTKTQPSALQNATTRSYSWSYALGWLSVFFELLAALLLFLCAVCCVPSVGAGDKDFFDINTLNSTKSHGQRNMAYEYVERKTPMVFEAQPHMISDGSYHDHFRGRHYDPYSRAPVQQEGRVQAQYNYEQGGWSWQ